MTSVEPSMRRAASSSWRMSPGGGHKTATVTQKDGAAVPKPPTPIAVSPKQVRPTPMMAARSVVSLLI